MRRLATIVVSLTLAACSVPDGPRELPAPEFDTRLPFPELTVREGGDDDRASQKNFEQRIAEAGSDEAGGRPATTSQQLVPLAGRFVMEMPNNFDEWQWSASARTSLISYRESGATHPSALMYVEEFSTLARTSPSFEMNRFQRTVDPNLAQDLVPPALTSMAADFAAEKTNLPVDKLVNTVMRGISHTMGAGLNYRSAEDSFTGWKWVGQTDEDISLRFGRTSGAWSSQATFDPSVQRSLDEAAAQSETFGRVAEAYRQTQNDQSGGAARRDRAAWMLVGAASTSATSGVHIAIVCTSQPACPVSEQLAEMLASLRPADATAMGRVGEPSRSRPADKARDLGIPFLPSEDMMSPGELESLLRQLGTQQ